MSVALAAARVIYFAAILQLFGLLTFGLFFEAAPQRRWAWALIVLVLMAMSGWLALEAQEMSGERISLDTVRVIVHETRFGELWIARAGLLIAAALVPWRWVATILVGSVLALTAAAGHAGATGNTFELSADAIHLVAVGAWLGGLVPFAQAIMRPGRPMPHAMPGASPGWARSASHSYSRPVASMPGIRSATSAPWPRPITADCSS